MQEFRKQASIIVLTLITIVTLIVKVEWPTKRWFSITNDPCLVQCTTGEPCQYPDEFDFRIIVLTFNRPESLRKCLTHIAKLYTLGDRVSVDIWIDRSKDGEVDDSTVTVSREFQKNWTQGQVCVHIQQRNAYLIGQWIDTWRPRENSHEIALILEDDIDISPLTYKWLKLMNSKFRNVSDVGGYTLQMQNVNYVKPNLRAVSNIPKTDNVFLYRLFGTWGYSPKPNEWRGFQDWFHEVRKDNTFKPYMPDLVINKWFTGFESQGTSDSMCSMWSTYYFNKSNLFTVYSNLKGYTGQDNTLLDINRMEPGLHYKGNSSMAKDKSFLLLSQWKTELEIFPEYIPRYDFDGSFVNSSAKNNNTYL
ncbi:hypothetical protein LSH36_152g04054 [Paralvinella palmiformis]|uniref:Uncharacterized protein n=1 Tax=Paralvinella palmiformis TaxID=53620 RepID=A0AAD9N708_9ANNE|nr:hypothetical protein LSH36_152g04054 [Paralvinella palmiformis]